MATPCRECDAARIVAFVQGMEDVDSLRLIRDAAQTRIEELARRVGGRYGAGRTRDVYRPVQGQD